jgi:hypothetical protein
MQSFHENLSPGWVVTDEDEKEGRSTVEHKDTRSLHFHIFVYVVFYASTVYAALQEDRRNLDNASDAQ